MRWSGLIALSVVLGACSGRTDAPRIAEAQARSFYPPTAEWKPDPALPPTSLQEMRDRAYAYCFREKPADEKCLEEQDESLFHYANSFWLVRLFRAEEKPVFPFAVGHQQDPTAFERVHLYCRSVYEDHGARDARGLGPCMSAGLGADYFEVVPVP